MTIPRLPNEVMIMALEEAVAMYDNDASSDDEKTTKMIIHLSTSPVIEKTKFINQLCTSKDPLLKQFGMMKKHQTKEISAHPHKIREAADEISNAEVAMHVKSLKLELGEEDYFDIGGSGSWGQRANGFRESAKDEVICVANGSIWSAEVSFHLTRFLPLCLNLEKLTISAFCGVSDDVPFGWPWFHMFARILSTYRFPKLKSLEFVTDYIGIAEPFWMHNEFTPKGVPILHDNLSRVTEFRLTRASEVYDDVEPTHHGCDMKKFSAWLGCLTNLELLRFEATVHSYGEDNTNTPPDSIFLSPLVQQCKFTNLKTLEFHYADVDDNITSLITLPAIKETLRNVGFTYCRVKPSQDRWKNIYTALLNLTNLKRVKMLNTGYSEGPGYDCFEEPVLCTPYDDDIQGLQVFLEAAEEKGVTLDIPDEHICGMAPHDD